MIGALAHPCPGQWPGGGLTVTCSEAGDGHYENSNKQTYPFEIHGASTSRQDPLFINVLAGSEFTGWFRKYHLSSSYCKEADRHPRRTGLRDIGRSRNSSVVPGPRPSSAEPTTDPPMRVERGVYKRYVGSFATAPDSLVKERSISLAYILGLERRPIASTTILFRNRFGLIFRNCRCPTRRAAISD